ncbi:MAG: hypothetical protein AB8E15_04280 [Bdellovibrionales bacterium]
MQHVQLWITKLVLLGGLFLSSSCTYLPEVDESLINRRSDPPFQKVFYEDYSLVWEAVQKASGRYQAKMSDAQGGVISTEIMKSDSGWISPVQQQMPPSGRRYWFEIRVLRVQDSKRNDAVKVSVKKFVQITRDFFSTPENLDSDGLEEQEVLYRVGREILLEKGLRKFNKDLNN